MKEAKYIGKIIKREFHTLDATTQEILTDVTFEQKALNDINGLGKYIYVELFTDMGTVSAAKMGGEGGIYTQAHDKALELGCPEDYNLYMVKSGRKQWNKRI